MKKNEGIMRIKKNEGIIRISNEMFNDIIDYEMSRKVFLHILYSAEIMFTKIKNDNVRHMKIIHAVSPYFIASKKPQTYIIKMRENISENNGSMLRHIFCDIECKKSDTSSILVYKDKVGIKYRTDYSGKLIT